MRSCQFFSILFSIFVLVGCNQSSLLSSISATPTTSPTATPTPTVSASTHSCSGYLDNSVVLNHTSNASGQLNYKLTNTKSTAQTVHYSIGGSGLLSGDIQIASGQCEVPITLNTQSIPTGTEANWTLSDGSVIASLFLGITGSTSGSSSCSGYLNNYVVVNSVAIGGGQISYNLTNTYGTTQTMTVYFAGSSTPASTIEIPSGVCSQSMTLNTQDYPVGTQVVFKDGSGTVIASDTTSAPSSGHCAGYLDNYVVINSNSDSTGQSSFNLSNTNATSKSVHYSFVGHPELGGDLQIAAGKCDQAVTLNTQSIPAGTKVVWTLDDGSEIADWNTL